MIQVESYIPIPIQFLPADPGSTDVVAEIVKIVQQKIQNAQFEHIGSTAIPGMPGKNIINLQLLTKREDYAERLGVLQELGFIPSNSPLVDVVQEPVCVATVAFEGKQYTVHILLTPQGSPYHKNAVFFRDYLIAHPAVSKEYAQIKKAAVLAGKTDPVSYNKAKEPFIQSILSKRGNP